MYRSRKRRVMSESGQKAPEATGAGGRGMSGPPQKRTKIQPAGAVQRSQLGG
jgi:hypothetical protein